MWKKILILLLILVVLLSIFVACNKSDAKDENMVEDAGNQEQAGGDAGDQEQTGGDVYVPAPPPERAPFLLRN